MITRLPPACSSSLLSIPRCIASRSSLRPRSLAQAQAQLPLLTISRRHNSSSSSSSSSSYTPTRPCPSCHRQIPLPLSPCPSCSTLLPLPSTLSHHSLLYLSSPILPSSQSKQFDIPTELASLPANGYGLDKADLRSKWVRRQRELHPDKYSSKGDKEVDMARELSGRVNEAYNVLGDELKRAEYLLSIHQQGPEETDKIDDPLLLAEILEAREELEEASNQDEIESIRASNREKVSEIISSLTDAFSQKPPNLEEAKTLAVQLRYWQGLEKAAKERVVE
ncbi:Fe-S protein assembly co-chaperone HscB [Kwoniella shandongensis]|uniref:Fe-S protein assembly co-chaperone HscB n=1 Tax=Kwoniella shandongensis TaxID=1734106 RepID=A0A5M6BX87_9TREE|nr:Fe-S protein assembly co-chaperone HscB [Kwoniella shandongensis]KAA5527487.1 Fe-S protein assembly co-chaperone HscB [Kwoniella shandongensis]